MTERVQEVGLIEWIFLAASDLIKTAWSGDIGRGFRLAIGAAPVLLIVSIAAFLACENILAKQALAAEKKFNDEHPNVFKLPSAPTWPPQR